MGLSVVLLPKVIYSVWSEYEFWYVCTTYICMDYVNLKSFVDTEEEEQRQCDAAACLRCSSPGGK